MPDALGRRTNRGGFIGISFGVEHFYADRRSIAAEFSGIMDLPGPVTGRALLSGWHELNRTINLSLTNNYHTRVFSLGYGLNFSQSAWSYEFYDDNWDYSHERFEHEELREPFRWKFGAMLNAYYKISSRTRLGVVYRPSFYRLGARTPWAYEHSISIDLKFNMNVGRTVRSL